MQLVALNFKAFEVILAILALGLLVTMPRNTIIDDVIANLSNVPQGHNVVVDPVLLL